MAAPPSLQWCSATASIAAATRPLLLVLNMADGSVIREIVRRPTVPTTNNGLFAPTGIYAADGKTLVYAYAGDLQGNVWKFDMTSTSPSDPGRPRRSSTRKRRQARRSRSRVASRWLWIVSTNKRWVFFGTGSYLTAADGNDAGTSKQSMYGVIDDITHRVGLRPQRSDVTQRNHPPHNRYGRPCMASATSRI